MKDESAALRQQADQLKLLNPQDQRDLIGMERVKAGKLPPGERPAALAWVDALEKLSNG